MDKAVVQLLHDLYSVGLSTAHLFQSASAEACDEPIRAALHAPLERGGGGGGGDSGGQILDESWSRSTDNASYLCECDANGERASVPRSHRPPYMLRTPCVHPHARLHGRRIARAAVPSCVGGMRSWPLCSDSVKREHGLLACACILLISRTPLRPPSGRAGLDGSVAIGLRLRRASRAARTWLRDRVGRMGRAERPDGHGVARALERVVFLVDEHGRFRVCRQRRRRRRVVTAIARTVGWRGRLRRSWHRCCRAGRLARDAGVPPAQRRCAAHASRLGA